MSRAEPLVVRTCHTSGSNLPELVYGRSAFMSLTSRPWTPIRQLGLIIMSCIHEATRGSQVALTGWSGGYKT